MKWTTWRMAWRNLWRHTQRTLLMIATVAFGSWVILVMWGITDGFFASMTTSQAMENQGDFQIRAVGYAEDPIPSNGVESSLLAQIEDSLAELRLGTTAPRLEAFGMIQSAYGTNGVSIRGIDPLRERTVTTLHQQLTSGRYVDAPGEILLSTQLAADLDVRIGERVVLLAMSDSGTESAAFTAVGFFTSTMPELEQVALVSLEDAQALSGWSGVTALAVNLPPGASSSRAIRQTTEHLAGYPGVEVADYFALNPMARLMMQGGTVKMIPFEIMISVLVGFGVANTTFYSVLERTREFGVMTAVGMSRKQLARLILLESVFVSGIGFAAGGGLGYGLLVYMSRVGLDFGGMMEGLSTGFGMPTVIYASTSGWYWIGAFSVVVFTALAATWYPARRVNRLEPVTAIREG